MNARINSCTINPQLGICATFVLVGCGAAPSVEELSWLKSCVSPSRLTPATQTLPQNVEAEAALLGALMIDNRLVEDVQLKLQPHHFYEPLHGRIYEAILRMTDANRIANPVTLRPLFDCDELIKEVGGPAYLAQLTGSGAAVIGARDFAQQIYDLALLRALVGVGRDLVEGALDTSEDVAPLAQIERAETELYKVAEAGGAEGKAKSFAEATKDALEMAERALNSGGHLSGFTTGLDSLNAKIGGLHKSDLIIVAGRPGMGKSALGTNMAFAAAQRFLRDAEEGIEPAKSAGRRPRCSASKCRPTSWPLVSCPSSPGITSENLRTGRITQQEFRELARAAAELQSLPLLHRRHAGPDDRGASHARPAAQAAKGDRGDRRRLSAAAAGNGKGTPTKTGCRKSPKSAAD